MLNWRDWKNPAAGGAEAVVDNIMRHLALIGHNVTLFTSAYEGCKNEENTKYGKIVRRGTRYTVYFYAFLFYLNHGKDFDFIIESVSTVPFFAPLYHDNGKIIIIPHHIMGSTIFKEVGPVSGSIAYIAERLIPLLYRKTKFIAVSNAVKTDLIEMGVAEKNVTQCYFGAPTTFKPVKTSKYDKPTLITVSRLMKYKRVDTLLEIFKNVNKRLNASFLIVGTGKEIENLKNYAGELGLGKSVSFIGSVTEHKKAELLSRSWVFVTASEREGFGITALEAELCGTPVVAFNNGGLGEAISNNYSGFLVKDGDRTNFERSVIKLLTNKRLRERFFINSVEQANKFDIKEGVNKLDKIIKES